METLLENFKSVALEKSEIDNGVNKNFVSTFFGFVAYQESILRYKNKIFSIWELFISITPSIPTLTEEFKAVVLEKKSLSIEMCLYYEHFCFASFGQSPVPK